jgi:hypothetical protein
VVFEFSYNAILHNIFFKLEKMNKQDDGFFHYNDNFPPLCIKPPKHQEIEFNDCMENGVIITYLQESYKDGIKDPNNILPSGLSAGEAAVLYFRDINDKRKKSLYTSVDVQNVINQIIENMNIHMGIDVKDTRYIFDKYINQNIFHSKQYKKRVLPALKAYLKDVNMKSKGYTHKLKNVLNDVSDDF